MAIKFNKTDDGKLIRDESSKFSTHHVCVHGKQCEHLEYIADPSDDLPKWLIGHIGILVCNITDENVEDMRRELIDCPLNQWDAEWIIWQDTINGKLEIPIDSTSPITASSIGYEPMED